VLRRYADPQQFFNSTAAGSCDKQARAAGLKHTPWTRTGRNSQGMTNAMAELLRNATMGVSPGLKFCRRCKGMVSNVESWEYRRDAGGDLLNGDDAYVDADNDMIDPVRGIIATNFLQRLHAAAQVVEPVPYESPLIRGRSGST